MRPKAALGMFSYLYEPCRLPAAEYTKNEVDLKRFSSNSLAATTKQCSLRKRAVWNNTKLLDGAGATVRYWLLVRS